MRALATLPSMVVSLVLVALAVPAQVGAEDIKDPATVCGILCPDRPCEKNEFRGFSSDSTQFGHSVLQCPGPQGTAPRIVYHAAVLAKTGRKLAYSPVPKRNETFPLFYSRHDYEAKELTPTRIGNPKEQGTPWEYLTPAGIQITFYWRTESKVAWYFEVRRNGKLRYTYRKEFDEIYYAVAPRVFISPDGKKAALVMSLDALIKEDAGIAVFRLRK